MYLRISTGEDNPYYTSISAHRVKCDEFCGAKQERILPGRSRHPRGVARKMPAMVLFAFADAEHFSTAGWTHALGSRSAVFHCNFLWVFHFFFGFTFHTISLHLFPPLIFLKPATRFSQSQHYDQIVRAFFLIMDKRKIRMICLKLRKNKSYTENNRFGNKIKVIR